MKPLSELERKWREEEKLFLEYAAHPDNPEASERWKAVAKEKGICADELEAWLREADKWSESQQVSSWGTVNEVWTNAWMITRQYLLGTTRQERKK